MEIYHFMIQFLQLNFFINSNSASLMSWERRNVLISGTGITGESYGKDKIGSILHSIYQYKFPMGQKFKCKNNTIYVIKENIDEFLHTWKLETLSYNSKSRFNKGKV